MSTKPSCTPIRGPTEQGGATTKPHRRTTNRREELTSAKTFGTAPNLVRCKTMNLAHEFGGWLSSATFPAARVFHTNFLQRENSHQHTAPEQCRRHFSTTSTPLQFGFSQLRPCSEQHKSVGANLSKHLTLSTPRVYSSNNGSLTIIRHQGFAPFPRQRFKRQS